MRASEAGLEGTTEPLAPSGSVETAEIEQQPRRRVVATRARGVELGVRVVFEEDGTPAANVGVYLRSVRKNALGVELRTNEAGLARLRVGNAPGAACGQSNGAGRAATTIVRAHAAMGETLAYSKPAEPQRPDYRRR